MDCSWRELFPLPHPKANKSSTATAKAEPNRLKETSLGISEMRCVDLTGWLYLPSEF